MDKKHKTIYTVFPQGKHKVLTLSYDDGKITDRRMIDILNKYGIKCTFNCNSGLEKANIRTYFEERIPLSEYKTVYKGHEVACHTVTHPTIARCPKEQIVWQVLEDRRGLEDVMGTTIRGMAYPNGSYDDQVVDALKACGIVHARTVTSTHSFEMPADYLRWNPTVKHNDPKLDELCDEFLKLKKTQYFYMFYLWGHSYEFERDNNWEIIENFSKKMSGQEDIWYATNIEIVDYLEASKRVQISVSGDFAYNPNAMDIWLEVDKKPVLIKGGTQICL